jgi:hypothetical protein
LHRTPKAFRVAGTFVRLVLLLTTTALVVRFAFEAPPPDFRDFGEIQTQVGVAEVACGGEPGDVVAPHSAQGTGQARRASYRA